ncbi:MAG: hypothetical protein U0871_03165 [Gemmataceae bacterium]
MAVATFDTLKFANTLKAAGVPDKQAEAQAAAFAELIQANFKELATKDDLDRLAKDLRREISDLRDEIKREIAQQTARMDVQLATLRGEQVLLRWMMGATFAGVIAVLVRLFTMRPI